MSAVLVASVMIVGFLAAYGLYGRYLRTHILALDPGLRTPAHEFRDDIDFVPTNRWVLFGHHFASIAGLGPIVGPALAVIWGWLPAMLWVFFGTIFIGAVHDFAALVVSLRHQGRSIGDLTDQIIGKRARLLFLVIIFFLLALAMGVFALVISVMFVLLHPEAIIPVFSLMVIAMLIGTLVHRFKFGLAPMTVVGLGLMFVTIWIGIQHPVAVYRRYLDPPTAKKIAAVENNAQLAGQVMVVASGQSGFAQGALMSVADGRRRVREAIEGQRAPMTVVSIRTSRPGNMAGYFKAKGDSTAAAAVMQAARRAMKFWTWVLLAYAFVASVIPVWLLLQPRDYLNSFKLYLGLLLMLGGMFVLRPMIVAPAYNAKIAAELPLFPFLFVTIACGAISGFHCLVSSGTTARQLASEEDALFIGYGAMLTEGFLAMLVVLACTAGLGSAALWNAKYASLQAMQSLPAKLGAFIEGAGYFATGLGVPQHFGEAFIAVLVVAFAMTTLDSATRLLRYNVEELAGTFKLTWLANRYVASLIAVAGIGYFAFFEIDGKSAGFVLWQLFGSTNQLLGALSLLVVTIFLVKRGKPIWPLVLPMLFMFAVTVAAMVATIGKNLKVPDKGRGEYTLLAVAIGIMVLTFWMVIEGLLAWRRHRGVVTA